MDLIPIIIALGVGFILGYVFKSLIIYFESIELKFKPMASFKDKGEG